MYLCFVWWLGGWYSVNVVCVLLFDSRLVLVSVEFVFVFIVFYVLVLIGVLVFIVKKLSLLLMKLGGVVVVGIVCIGYMSGSVW